MDETLQQRIEAAVREEVSIIPYDLHWPLLFEIEAEHLRARLPASIFKRIEHFGSTAVPGLAAAQDAEALRREPELAAVIGAALPADRVVAMLGFGRLRHVPTNDTPEGRQTNRRVEIVISDTEK